MHVSVLAVRHGHQAWTLYGTGQLYGPYRIDMTRRDLELEQALYTLNGMDSLSGTMCREGASAGDINIRQAWGR